MSHRTARLRSNELEGVGQPTWGASSGRLSVVPRRNVAESYVLENPHALEHRLKEPRHLQRQGARRKRGSRQYKETSAKITRLHNDVAHVRRHTIHVFTTNLAKTHGVLVVEGLDAASLLNRRASRVRVHAGGGS